jgi:RNA polymerase sigma factor (sigma-70 family)
MDRAEALYWELEPEGRYPLEFVSYRITRFAPEPTDEDILLIGRAVREDLLLMVDQLSQTLDDRAEAFDPLPYDQPGLAERLGVTKRTIARYRREGLFARRLIWPDGKRKLSFLQPSVERFIASRPEQLKAAASFGRLDESTRHQIITRARRIATRRPSISPFAVAEHLAGKYGRSVESIRQLLLEHDRHDRRVAIFRGHRPPLTVRQQRIIHRAYHRGVSVTRMAEHFGRSRDAIYRALNQRRAAAIRRVDLRWQAVPTFELDDAEEVILRSRLPDESLPPADGTNRDTTAHSAVDPDALPDELRELAEVPPPAAPAEQAMFVRYNFLKYRADLLRRKLDRYRPAARQLDEIETALRWAVSIKQELARRFFRLVVAGARAQAIGSSAGIQRSFSQRIDQGAAVLMQAVDDFDVTRGVRFATYLNWALMRRFAATASDQPTHPSRDRRPHAERAYWPVSMDPARARLIAHEPQRRLLDRIGRDLDPVEQAVVMRHFGLADTDQPAAGPQTMQQISQTLNIPLRRARQIETRALRKLRRSE